MKAIDENGNPINIKGKIIDSSGKQINELTTNEDGIGKFVIHPMPGNFYTAVVELNNGIKKKFSLPEIKNNRHCFAHGNR